MAKESDTTVYIPDEFEPYPMHCFVSHSFYEEDLLGVILTEGMMRDRTKRMAQEICEAYGNHEFLALGVLNGCYRFYYELLEEIKNFQKGPIEYDFVRIKSYIGTDQKGISILSNDSALREFKDKHILIVEDIIDTGRSMTQFIELLRSKPEYRPRDIKIAVLLSKRNNRNVTGLKPDFTGFSIPDIYVVGAGFDRNNYLRDVPHLCIMNEACVREKYFARSCVCDS